MSVAEKHGRLSSGRFFGQQVKERRTCVVVLCVVFTVVRFFLPNVICRTPGLHPVSSS